MNTSKELIETSRFKINPHHSSGSLIHYNHSRSKTVITKPSKNQVKIFTTESVEYYKALHRKMKEDEENRKKLIYQPAERAGVVVASSQSAKRTKKPSCLRKNNTLENNGIILDNYVEFIPKK